MTELTTHVLDTTDGRPAAGIPVSLQTRQPARRLGRDRRRHDRRRRPHRRRCRRQAHSRIGCVFDLSGRGGFYPEVAITFEVGADEDHLHVPLLLSPFGYTTYRGS